MGVYGMAGSSAMAAHVTHPHPERPTNPQLATTNRPVPGSASPPTAAPAYATARVDDGQRIADCGRSHSLDRPPTDRLMHRGYSRSTPCRRGFAGLVAKQSRLA